jgi:DNA topoisomerase-1
MTTQRAESAPPEAIEAVEESGLRYVSDQDAGYSRRRVVKDLGLPGLPREKVIAAVVRLLDKTAIRIGSEEYRKENRSYGLTTMRDRHVQFEQAQLLFEFRGKGGLKHRVALNDKRLAKIVRWRQEPPGQELFQYLDEDERRQAISSTDVNEYLQDVAGQPFTSKGFRTWAGTVEAAAFLSSLEPPGSSTEAKKNMAAAVKQAAAHLRNRPATCRKHYIHPAVLEAYEAGEPLELSEESEEGLPASGLRSNERALLVFLRQRHD